MDKGVENRKCSTPFSPFSLPLQASDPDPMIFIFLFILFLIYPFLYPLTLRRTKKQLLANANKCTYSEKPDATDRLAWAASERFWLISS